MEPELGVPVCSLGNISSNVKGTHEYDGSKEPEQKVIKEGSKLFMKKFYFDKKKSSKTYNSGHFC